MRNFPSDKFEYVTRVEFRTLADGLVDGLGEGLVSIDRVLVQALYSQTRFFSLHLSQRPTVSSHEDIMIQTVEDNKRNKSQNDNAEWPSHEFPLLFISVPPETPSGRENPKRTVRWNGIFDSVK